MVGKENKCPERNIRPEAALQQLAIHQVFLRCCALPQNGYFVSGCFAVLREEIFVPARREDAENTLCIFKSFREAGAKINPAKPYVFLSHHAFKRRVYI